MKLKGKLHDTRILKRFALFPKPILQDGKVYRLWLENYYVVEQLRESGLWETGVGVVSEGYNWCWKGDYVSEERAKKDAKMLEKKWRELRGETR